MSTIASNEYDDSLSDVIMLLYVRPLINFYCSMKEGKHVSIESEYTITKSINAHCLTSWFLPRLPWSKIRVT